MSKPLSDEALLVAKALKNFDPEKYYWYSYDTCVAGQYTKGVLCDVWWNINNLVKKIHFRDHMDPHDGKAIAAALRKEYDLSENFINGV